MCKSSFIDHPSYPCFMTLTHPTTMSTGLFAVVVSWRRTPVLLNLLLVLAANFLFRGEDLVQAVKVEQQKTGTGQRLRHHSNQHHHHHHHDHDQHNDHLRTRPRRRRGADATSSSLLPSLSSFSPQPRIVNGDDVRDGNRYPYYVSLVDSLDRHVCGGTLIALDVVLTAAHCEMLNGNNSNNNNMDRSLITAIVGIHNRNNDNNSNNVGVDSTERRHAIASHHVHPEFHFDDKRYDQMLVILHEPVVWSSTAEDGGGVKPTVRVNLDPLIPVATTVQQSSFVTEATASSASEASSPSSSSSFLSSSSSGSTMTIVGLGATSIGGLEPTILQETTVDYVPNDNCKEFELGSFQYEPIIKDDMICGWGMKEGDSDRKNGSQQVIPTGQCYGDSGGPYLITTTVAAAAALDDVNGTMMDADFNDTVTSNTNATSPLAAAAASSTFDLQVGIVSFGVGCANLDVPSVGSRTSAGADFIVEYTCALSRHAPDYFDCPEKPTMTTTTTTTTASPTSTPWTTMAPSSTVPANTTDEVAAAEQVGPRTLPPTIAPTAVNDTSTKSPSSSPVEVELQTVYVAIYLDKYPGAFAALSWSVWDVKEEVLYKEVPEYPFEDIMINDTMELPSGKSYKFVLQKRNSNDGEEIDTSSVLYEIRVIQFGIESSVLLQGNAEFETERKQDFEVPILPP